MMIEMIVMVTTMKAMIAMNIEQLFFEILDDYSDDLCRIRLAERHPRFSVGSIHVHINHTGLITPTFGHSFSVHSFYSATDKGTFELARMSLMCVMSNM